MTSFANILPLAGLAAIFAGIAGRELLAPPPVAVPVPPLHLAAAPEAVPAGAASLSATRSREILARPLFRQDRRPPVPPAAAKAGEAALPRLSGIMIGSGQRLAFFAEPGGKTVAVGAGGVIGRYRLIEIGDSSVTLADGAKRLVVAPRFDAAKAAMTMPVIQPSPRLRGFGMPERR